MSSGLHIAPDAWQVSTGAQQGRPARQESSSSLPRHVLPCLAAIAEIGRGNRALAALVHLGIEVGANTPFRCVLPHRERPPHAARVVWDSRKKMWKYRCGDPEHPGARWFRLCDVRAALASGRIEWLTESPVDVLWYARLWHEAGLLEGVERVQVHVPASAPGELRAVADGFGLLWALRAAMGFHEPTPFTDRFVPPWCGVPRRKGGVLRNQLVAMGAIRLAGWRRFRGGPRPAGLYVPVVDGEAKGAEWPAP